MILPQEITHVAAPPGYFAVLPNYGDLAFIKIILDPTSCHFFIQNMRLVRDTIARSLIWKSLYEMVKDAKLFALDFIDSVLKNMPDEPNDELFLECFNYLDFVLKELIPWTYREAIADKIYLTLASFFNLFATQSNRLLNIQKLLIRFAYSQKMLSEYVNWSYGKC